MYLHNRIGKSRTWPKDTKHSEISYSNSLLMDNSAYDNEQKGHFVNDYASGVGVCAGEPKEKMVMTRN